MLTRQTVSLSQAVEAPGLLKQLREHKAHSVDSKNLVAALVKNCRPLGLATDHESKPN